jgi:hypothetical protein
VAIHPALLSSRRQVTPDQYMYTEPFMDKIKETFEQLRSNSH